MTSRTDEPIVGHQPLLPIRVAEELGAGDPEHAPTLEPQLGKVAVSLLEHGQHLGIYHVGTAEEITIADLARRIARHAGRDIELKTTSTLPGSTPRRCPAASG